MQADRTLTITLDPAIEHKGGKIVELRLREPTGAEMREAERKLTAVGTPEATSDFEVALIGTVSGLSEDAINALSVSVMRRAVDFVLGFDREPPPEAEGPTLELDLPEPVQQSGVSYAKLELREPTVGTRRRAETALRGGSTPANFRGYQLVLVAEASGVPFAAVELVGVSTLNRAAAFLQGFMMPGRKTGSA